MASGGTTFSVDYGAPGQEDVAHRYESTDGWGYYPDQAAEPSVMRPLRYSIDVTLDGCCDHRAMIADEESRRHAVSRLEFDSEAVAMRYEPIR